MEKKKQYFQKGRMTGENIAKRFVEKYPVPTAVYKNNIHKSGINLNSRFSDRQKNAQKCYGLNEGKLETGCSNENTQKNYVPADKISL